MIDRKTNNLYRTARLDLIDSDARVEWTMILSLKLAPRFDTSDLVKFPRRTASIKQSIELPLLPDYLDSPTSSKQISSPLGITFPSNKVSWYLAASRFTPDRSLL